MSTILAYTSPAVGNLYPLMALLRELHRRGHRIVVRTLADAVASASELGFESSAVDPRIEAIKMVDWMAATPRAAVQSAFRVFAMRAEYEVADIRSSILAVRPDVTIVDANCWGAPAVLDVASMPWVSFWPYPPILKSKGVPPFGPGLRPWHGLVGRLRDEAIRPVVDRAFEGAMRKPLNDVCTAVGAKPLVSACDLVERAPLVLVATAPPLEYAHPGWDDRVQMIGHCEFSPPERSGVRWLEAIARPIILVTTSTERQADEALPLAVMAVMRDRPFHVVATFPCGIPRSTTIPDNATVRRFVPHGAVLDRAVCAVTHGGMGVTQKALARGVPVCVVPFGRDQFEVARRVEVARCGTRLPSRRLTESRLQSRIAKAMTKVDGARRVAAGFTAAGGVVRGADLVEQRLLSLGPSADV